MRSVQRYVSDELTHFVGRAIVQRGGDPDEMAAEQYRVLVSILESKKLLPSSLDPGGGPHPGVATSFNPKAALAEMFVSEVVCFCDIPVEDLGLHITKYAGSA